MNIRFATPEDVPNILKLIKALAEFEKLAHEVTATENLLMKNLFTERKSAEVLIAEDQSVTTSQSGSASSPTILGCAIFFHSFSTFLAKPGLYLEDLFVTPEQRGKGTGMALLKKLAQVALERDCGRMEWSVLDWNQKAIDLYTSIGAKPQDGWTVMRMTTQQMKTLAE